MCQYSAISHYDLQKHALCCFSGTSARTKNKSSFRMVDRKAELLIPPPLQPETSGYLWKLLRGLVYNLINEIQRDLDHWESTINYP